MDVSRWFNYYSFDVMGDLSFGKSFDMLVDGKDAYILKQLHADMKNVGLFSHLTWLFPFFKRIPVLNTDYLRFWSWVDKRVEERIQVSHIPLEEPWEKKKQFLTNNRDRTLQIALMSFPGFWKTMSNIQRQNKIPSTSTVMHT